jgi:hypothetical protein
MAIGFRRCPSYSPKSSSTFLSSFQTWTVCVENIEKQNENLCLLYVACTRAMELLIVPDLITIRM